MKVLFVTLFVVLICQGSASAQQHFLNTRVLIPCLDMTRYAAFLEKFGFHTSSQLGVPNEAQTALLRLTDGQIFLTLMRAEFKGVHLAMFTDDIAAYEKQIPKAAIANIDRNGSSIDEIDISAPGGVGIFMHPSPVSTLPDSVLNEKIGAFVEFSIGVTNLDSAITFWKSLGYQITSQQAKPYPSATLKKDNFVIGLHTDPNFDGPALSYATTNVVTKIALIKASGIEPITTIQNNKGETVGASFQAPEGLIVNVYDLH